MNWADYAITGVILSSSVASIMRGFIKNFLSLISWVISIWVALVFHTSIATLLIDYITIRSIRLFMSFFTLFAVILILMVSINNLISRLVKNTILMEIDRSLGAIFGLFRGIAIVTILVLLAGITAIPSENWWQHSLLIRYFEHMAIWVKSFFPNDIAKYVKFDSSLY